MSASADFFFFFTVSLRPDAHMYALVLLLLQNISCPMSVTTRMNHSWLWLSWLFPQLPPQMALPGFGGISQILPRMFWEHTAFVPIVIFGLRGGFEDVFGERERRYELGHRGGEESRSRIFQHFSPPVITKTTKNSLVKLFPSALSLPSLCHSFLHSLLHLRSQCILLRSTADWDQIWWVWLWKGGNVEYVIRWENQLYFLSWRALIILPSSEDDCVNDVRGFFTKLYAFRK